MAHAASQSASQPRKKFPDPHEQQRTASDPLNSVWVNASAGSGKTTILTNRVMRLLLLGVRPEKILCLTYTRAAAAEMSLRLMKELGQWATCSGNDLNALLSKLQGRAPTEKETIDARRLLASAIACPGGMRIRTIHAFGQEVLRRFPIESNLPPHFQVIEETDAATLQDEALNDLLQEAAAQPESAEAKALAMLITTLGEMKFREVALNLLSERAPIVKAIQQRGDLGNLINHVRSALELEPGDTEDTLVQAFFDSSRFNENEIRDAAKLLAEDSILYSRRADKILEWLAKDANQRLKDFAQYKAGFLTQDNSVYAARCSKGFITKHSHIDEMFLREGTRLTNIVERCAAVKVAETTSAALIFGSALADKYTQKKRLRAALDYDDLVTETLNLLRRPGIAPWILYKLDNGLDHLLVDESQDTSRTQWEIVQILADEFFSGASAKDTHRTFFVVGDEKQSIFSFQKADPDAFNSMRNYYAKKISSVGKELREIPLHVSFRSAPAVLRAVDAVFAGAAADGVSRQPVEHFSHKGDALSGRVELWPLQPQKDKKTKDASWELPLGYESERDPQAELAQQIAATIHDWLTRGETLPGENRPIQPGDIMILLRRRGRFADLMVRALKQKPFDIPVTGVDRMHLMKQLPVMDLLALIQFVLLPEDDLNLATLLRGPLIGISEEKLMELAAARGGLPLWQNLKKLAHKSGLMPVQNYLEIWLGQADFVTPFAMLSGLLSAPCPASPVSGKQAIWQRLGLDALDPIDELLNAAQNFSHTYAPSLQSFLHWLTASDSEIKRELDSGAGQVRIMTVHASKGLEAPIVFLPDTSNMPRAQDVAKLLWDEDHNLPFYLVRKPESGRLRTLWNKARTEQLQEYRRLLYVALTRASHRLYVGGWELEKNEADGQGSWYNLVKDGLKASEPHVEKNHAGKIIWEDPVLPATTDKQKIEKSSATPHLPAWAFTEAPFEAPSERSVAPSQHAEAASSATPDQAFAKGRIIHRLLQYLPDTPEARRETAAKQFLQQPRHGLNEAKQKEICDEVIRLLQTPAFSPLFSAGSRAEVPLTGRVDGKIISGQVDRLALVNNEVWIVDYKTNRPPPSSPTAIPQNYLVQMEDYRALLQNIYSGAAVRCFLLWTYGAVLMEVPKIAGEN